MHGTADPVYSVANAEDEISQFVVNSVGAELRIVQDAQTLPERGNPIDDVNTAAVGFINRWK